MEGKNLLNLLMRGLEFLWALLIMALIGNFIHDHSGGSPSIINYTMFCAVFAMLSLFLLIPASIKEAWGIMSFIPFTLDLLNTLFWFCAAVALPSYIGVHSCNNQGYLNTNRIIRGSHDKSGSCREAQASTAFLWFGFAAFAVSTAITGLGLSGGSMPRRGGVRRGPAMSQV